MFIGYARVSTADQTLALQEDALQKTGCEKIFKDVMSGSTTDRPGLSEVLTYARSGDVLVVWRAPLPGPYGSLAGREELCSRQ